MYSMVVNIKKIKCFRSSLSSVNPRISPLATKYKCPRPFLSRTIALLEALLLCNESINLVRDIGSLERVSRQIPGDVPDLAFKYNDNELGCVEIGLHDKGANSTKELNERKIKTPKIMRNSCWKMVNEYKMNPENTKLVGFVISGTHLSVNVMSFHGNAALVDSSSRIKMPVNFKEMARLFPRALRLCYNAGMVIKKTVEVIDEVCESEDVFIDEELFFPSAFELNEVNTSNKKRKTSRSSLSSDYITFLTITLFLFSIPLLPPLLSFFGFGIRLFVNSALHIFIKNYFSPFLHINCSFYFYFHT